MHVSRVRINYLLQRRPRRRLYTANSDDKEEKKGEEKEEIHAPIDQPTAHADPPIASIAAAQRPIKKPATRGLRALAVAREELDHDDRDGDGDGEGDGEEKREGNGFELIGLLAIFDRRVTIRSRLSTMLLRWVGK